MGEGLLSNKELVSSLSMGNKSPQNIVAYNSNNHFITSPGFCGSGIWEQLSRAVVGVSHEVSVRCWLGLRSSEGSTGAGGSTQTRLTRVPGEMLLAIG